MNTGSFNATFWAREHMIGQIMLRVSRNTPAFRAYLQRSPMCRLRQITAKLMGD